MKSRSAYQRCSPEISVRPALQKQFHTRRSLAGGSQSPQCPVNSHAQRPDFDRSAERSDLEESEALGQSSEGFDSQVIAEEHAAAQGKSQSPSTSRLANPDDSPSEATQPSGDEPEPTTKEPSRYGREQSFLSLSGQATTEDLEKKLRHHAHHEHSVDKVQYILQELVSTRHVQPQGRHYEALILSNCEPQQGSVTSLRRALEEMEREKIGIDHLMLSAVLKVLAIHPDAVLLASVLARMAEQWITASPDDTTNAILAYIRLNEFELALHHLTHLITTSPPVDNKLHSAVPQHLYQSFLYRLSSPAISDHTAILHLLYLITEHSLPLSPVCASYLLDNAAASLHLDLTLYLWRSHIDTSYIIPGSGLCRNALLTAARGGSAELATKCGRILEKRGVSEGTKDPGFWAKWGDKQGGGVGLEIEELEMVAEAYYSDKDEKGNPTIGWHAVNRIQRRIQELERAPSMARGKQIRRKRPLRISRDTGDRGGHK